MFMAGLSGCGRISVAIWNNKRRGNNTMTIPEEAALSRRLMQAEQRADELQSAINAYLDINERRHDYNSLMQDVQDSQRAIAGLYKAVGRKAKRPDFEDDDNSWHIGLDPADVERDWLAIWGDVAEPPTRTESSAGLGLENNHVTE